MPVRKTRTSHQNVKIARTYRLAPAQIAAAREALGAPTDTAAIEMALDMAVFAQELRRGIAALRRMRIDPRT